MLPVTHSNNQQIHPYIVSNNYEITILFPSIPCGTLLNVISQTLFF